MVASQSEILTDKCATAIKNDPCFWVGSFRAAVHAWEEGSRGVAGGAERERGAALGLRFWVGSFRAAVHAWEEGSRGDAGGAERERARGCFWAAFLGGLMAWEAGSRAGADAHVKHLTGVKCGRPISLERCQVSDRPCRPNIIPIKT